MAACLPDPTVGRDGAPIRLALLRLAAAPWRDVRLGRSERRQGKGTVRVRFEDRRARGGSARSRQRPRPAERARDPRRSPIVRRDRKEYRFNPNRRRQRCDLPFTRASSSPARPRAGFSEIEIDLGDFRGTFWMRTPAGDDTIVAGSRGTDVNGDGDGSRPWCDPRDEVRHARRSR